MEIICIHLKEHTIEYFQASNPSNTPNTRWCRYVRFTSGANWVGMATGRVTPIPFPSQNIWLFPIPSQTRGWAGRGMQSHPRYKVKIKIPSPTRPVLGVLSGRGWSYWWNQIVVKYLSLNDTRSDYSVNG